MTAAFNLAQLANNLNTSGQLDATDGLSGLVANSNLASSGTASSSTYLRGDRTWSSLPASGKVLQVVQSTLNTGGQSTSQTYVDLFSVSITPSSASSKILVLGYVNLSNSGQNGTFMRILRNSTNLLVGTGSNAINDGVGGTVAASSGFIQQSGTGYTVVPCVLNYLDSPASTSALTYKIQIRTGTTSAVYWNSQPGSGGTNADFGWFASTITAMEISA